MQAVPTVAKLWHKTCSRCGKQTFQDLLDEQGLCDYCREVIAMKASAKKKRE